MFDLPKCFVKRRSATGSELEVIGQEDILDTGFGILEADATQCVWALPGFHAGQFARLIAGQTFGFVDAPAFSDSIASVLALPSDTDRFAGNSFNPVGFPEASSSKCQHLEFHLN